MSDTGSVTVSGASGSAVIAISNSYAQAHANIFQNMTTAVIASGAGTYSYPAGSTGLVVMPGQGQVNVTGTAGSSALLVGDGDTLNYRGVGNATVFAGNGNDSVNTGAGSDLVALGSGQNRITLGGGANTVISSGTDRIFAGAGSATIVLSGVGSTVAGGTGAMSVDDSAGSGTVIYASSSLDLRGSDLGVTAVVGLGNSTVVGGRGGVGYEQVSGTLRLIGDGGSASVDGGAGAGPDSLYAASGGSVFLSGTTHNNVFVANDSVAGAGGSAVLDGSEASGGNQFWAGSGNTTLIGGSGSDTLVAGLGNVSMTGGSGAANTFDIFKFQAGSSVHVTITDFGAASGNVITLFGYGASGVSAALLSAKQSGLDTHLTLNDGTSITLSDYQATKLTTSSFLFTNPSSH